MRIFVSFETRAYPETRYAYPAEIDLEFMLFLSLRASCDDKIGLIEPASNPNRSRKVFEYSLF